MTAESSRRRARQRTQKRDATRGTPSSGGRSVTRRRTAAWLMLRSIRPEGSSTLRARPFEAPDVRAAEAADIVREQIRVQSWGGGSARQELRARTDRLREQEAHVRKRERNVARDERLASLAHARAEAKLEEATRRAAPSAPPRPAAERVRYRTLIPMRIEALRVRSRRDRQPLHPGVLRGAAPAHRRGSARQHNARRAERVR